METVFCIIGPTASGKTDLSLALAACKAIEIISVDSMMLYRSMDIGSAKPSLSQSVVCPHHLIDCLDPLEDYSVAQFVQEASTLIEAIFKRGRIPVLVGGTMLYFRALQQGLSQLPETSMEIRQAIANEAAQVGWPELYKQLIEVDPQLAARIQPQDTQRLSRALEVYRLTGEPLSKLQKCRPSAMHSYRFSNYLLLPKRRAWLHERIAKRFLEMIHVGLIDEVRSLVQQWPAIVARPVMRSVGYRQVLTYLQEQQDKNVLIEKGIVATRQVAKRQCTWLKTGWEGVYLDPEEENLSVLLKRL